MTESIERKDPDLPPSYHEALSLNSPLDYSQYPYNNTNHPSTNSSNITLPPISMNSAVSTPMAIDSPGPRGMDDLVAAQALARMTGSPPPVNISTPMSNLSIEEQKDVMHPLIAKVNQVSRHPIVRDAFKYYESSKRNYPHFNYAAGIVERAAIPVVTKIEDNLNSRHRQKLENPIKKKKRKNNRTDKKETKKRLQFCLHILRLANDQINNHVLNLQNRLSERELRIEEAKTEKPDAIHTPPFSAETNDSGQTAQETKTEIVTTVKKIIHVISNFKTSNLGASTGDSEGNELRSNIRDIILKLPRLVQQTNAGSEQTTEKIMVLAKESLDMISRLTAVFDDQLQKAEDWIGVETPADPISRSQTATPTALASPVADHKIQS